MNVIFEDGKPKFDIPAIEPMHIINEQVILDVEKTTLIKGDEKIILTGDEAGFYFKDKKYAALKQDVIKTKFYKLKRFLNSVLKTKFKLEEEKTMLHIIDYELFEKAKVTVKESE